MLYHIYLCAFAKIRIAKTAKIKDLYPNTGAINA